jgi:hypothetical protein
MRNQPRGRNVARRGARTAFVIIVIAAVILGLTGRLQEGRASAAPRVLGERQVAAQSALIQDLTVTRPAGDIAVAVSPVGADGDVDITVTDTRDDDRGWAVTMAGIGRLGRPRTTSIEATPAFADATGFVYAQEVVAGHGNVLVAAPAGHGLGIAQIKAHLAHGSAAGLTFTVA